MSDDVATPLIIKWDKLRRSLVGLRDTVKQRQIIAEITAIEETLRRIGVVRLVQPPPGDYPDTLSP